MGYKQERKSAMAAFERDWLQRMLAMKRTIADTAKEERVDRVYIHKLMRRHGITKDGVMASINATDVEFGALVDDSDPFEGEVP